MATEAAVEIETPVTPEAPPVPAETAPTEPKPEPTLAQRRATLSEIARAEKAKLHERRGERARSQQLEAQLAQERTARAADAARADEAAKRAQALEDEAKDPLGFLHKRGVAAKDIGDRIIKDNSPEAVTSEIQRQLDSMKAERAREREEFESLKKTTDQRQQYEAARQRLHATFAETKKDFPVLARICATPERLEREYLAAYQTIQSDPEARQHTYTDAEIFAAMEASRRSDIEDAIEALDVDVLEKHLTKRKGNGKTNAEASPAGAPQGIESAKAPKTLTNGGAGGAKQWFPDNFDKLSDKEQNRLLAEAHKAGWRG